MPTPIGHALAGVATAWAADLFPGDRRWRTASASASWYLRAGNGLTIACLALAVVPDVDLVSLAINSEGHRTITHSVGAVVFAGLLAAAIAVKARRPVVRVALMCAAAYATHLLLDWLGADNLPPRGLQLLWPFSSAFYISDLDLFPPTVRHHILTAPIIRVNVRAIAYEIAILLPIVVALWLVRVKALARFAAEMPRGNHAPQ